MLWWSRAKLKKVGKSNKCNKDQSGNLTSLGIKSTPIRNKIVYKTLINGTGWLSGRIGLDHTVIDACTEMFVKGSSNHGATTEIPQNSNILNTVSDIASVMV